MKRSLRFHAAHLVAKSAMCVQKLLRMNASYFPGKLALKLCPDFGQQIGKPEKIIAVTGTNGKTTSCNLALSILEDNGYTVLSNRLGSNVNAGIATALISGSTITGSIKKKYDLALFEVDERSSKLIYSYAKPDFLLCTNLFRDSIKRNAHTEYIFNFIDSAVPEKTHMILNADDIISGRLAENNSRSYFSILPMETDHKKCENIINDMSICPKCHANLEFSNVRYHHIGTAKCPACGFAMPKADYIAEADTWDMKLMVAEADGKHTYKLVNDSIFNIYNQLGVVALLREFGLTQDQISRSLMKAQIVGTRHTSDEVNGVKIVTNLAKSLNPVACSCVFDYVGREPGTKEVILILNGAAGTRESSENITWIFDTDFQFLNTPDVKRIIIGGIRAEDEKLRLLIAGYPEENIICTEGELDTPKYLQLDCDSVFILHDLNFSGYGAEIKETVINMLKNKEAK
ncbi:MAG: DUF1727 domain-containing protein [Oscillospiraceae bacterium]|nr:DUF1727 domain-containing protein [Oscillospiraceae bacterium]